MSPAKINYELKPIITINYLVCSINFGKSYYIKLSIIDST